MTCFNREKEGLKEYGEEVIHDRPPTSYDGGSAAEGVSRKRKRGEKAEGSRTGRAAKRGLWVATLATIERAKPGDRFFAFGT